MHLLLFSPHLSVTEKESGDFVSNVGYSREDPFEDSSLTTLLFLLNILEYACYLQDMAWKLQVIVRKLSINRKEIV